MQRKTFQNKCRKIIKELIKKSFPELKKKKILVFVPFFFRKAYSGLALWIPPFPRMLFLNKERSNESDSFLRGLLSHELGHQSLYFIRGLRKSIAIASLYWISKKFRRKEEDEVNRLIIKRGYAHEIYTTTKKLEKIKTCAGIQKYYMSSEEIKAYARKIGKW